MDADPPDEPALPGRHAPLTRRERKVVAAAALAPIAAAAVILLPVSLLVGASLGQMLAAALVYGGLLGLAVGFVAVDRMHAKQCPRCRQRNPKARQRCAGCDYDLVDRPRYACDQRHALYLDPGLCDCGRRLHRLPVARGLAREVVFILKLGGWLLAFLIGVGLLLRLLETNL